MAIPEARSHGRRGRRQVQRQAGGKQAQFGKAVARRFGMDKSAMAAQELLARLGQPLDLPTRVIQKVDRLSRGGGQVGQEHPGLLVLGIIDNQTGENERAAGHHQSVEAQRSQASPLLSERLDAVGRCAGEHLAFEGAWQRAHHRAARGFSAALPGLGGSWQAASRRQVDGSANDELLDARLVQMAYLDLSIRHQNVLGTLLLLCRRQQLHGITASGSSKQTGKTSCTHVLDCGDHANLDGGQCLLCLTAVVLGEASKEAGAEEPDPVDGKGLPALDSVRLRPALASNEPGKARQELGQVPLALAQRGFGGAHLRRVEPRGGQSREEGTSAGQQVSGKESEKQMCHCQIGSDGESVNELGKEGGGSVHWIGHDQVGDKETLSTSLYRLWSCLASPRDHPKLPESRVQGEKA